MAPPNKSKGTKKMTSRKRKAPMDYIPQSEERTTTAFKVSELPEVDTMEEIIRKRKEEELALQFVEPGSKELYLAGLDIKMEGNLARVIHEEKRMSWNGLKSECHSIIQKLRHKCGIVLPNPWVITSRVVEQPVPADALVPTSTSVSEVPTPTIETTPATSVATSSAPAAGPSIIVHGIRLIRLVEAKVAQLIEEFPAYVKEDIETTLTPHKENLEAVREERKSIRAQFHAIELRLGRIEGSGEKGLSTIREKLQRITTRLSALDPPEIVLAGQLREQRAQGTSGASSYSALPTHDPLPPSVGHMISLDTIVERAPASEIEPIGQTTSPSDTVDRVDGYTTQTDA
ncbi:hypothetical protein K7X08_019398 [Anisodus acutangulus]|uniref:Uncharacterized protein n=1 Tax=Anisodus acutangulus TaxID=402998 RepID=A0A9Q1MRI4_9SOLA|nr:hypothetical protein K7X08_019398 [Anisodus acutangulus]